MKRNIAIISALLLLCSGFTALAQQEYVATPVSISKEKVKDKDTGIVYYSHPVLAKQTLFSIAKAYGVTLEEIYEANPTLHLDTEPLQQYQILRIPEKSNSIQKGNAVEKSGSAEKAVNAPSQSVNETTQVQDGKDEYLTHVVKWYEDLAGIAKKYGISQDVIISYNSLSGSTLTKRQKLRIPQGNTLAREIAKLSGSGSGEESKENEMLADADNVSDNISEKLDEIFGITKKEIDFSLILPFNSAKTPSENNLDFYSGVLLAMRDLEKEGIKSEISVYDCAEGKMPVSAERFAKSDFVIGPVSVQDIGNALNISEESSVIISPLDPKAAELAASRRNIVHVPTPADLQCRDLIAWMKQELGQGDKVILLSEKNVTPTENAALLMKHLSESEVEYSTISYGILEGKDISTVIESKSKENCTTHIVIASESEAFVNDAIRNVNLLAYKGLPLSIYCLSRVRNFETIEVENFHSCKLHISMPYFVNYDSPEVQRFLMQYRALFNTEPGQFAFQGYDITRYFIKKCSEGGRFWLDKLEGSTEKGLQTNFRFTAQENGGYINTAIRRILYGSDFSIRMVN